MSKSSKTTPAVKEKKKRPDNALMVAEGDNAKFIQHNLTLFSMDKVDTTDPRAVCNRLEDYFRLCVEDDMKPTVAGMALALGIDRRRLWEIKCGYKGKSPEVMDFLKRAYDALEAQTVDYMMNGKVNPVTGIFLMKNHFNYTDKQDVVINMNPLGEAPEAQSLIDKYKDIVDVD